METKNSKSNCVLFFVKYPERGQVKSRLATEFDERITIKLYRSFVEDLLLMLTNMNHPIMICYSPPDAFDKFRTWLGAQHQYVPQRGSSLGNRMENGFLAAFTAGYEHVIIIGSDSPDLPSHLIATAFQKLKEHDVVIGPCPDGGYYILGFSKLSYFPSVFRDIKWSTEEVFSSTLKKLREGKLDVHVMPTWSDVDTLDDLYELFIRNKDKEFNTSGTMSLLSKYFKSKYFK